MFPDLTRDDVFRIETKRLWLRWPRLSDAQTVIRLAGDQAVAEMTAKVPHPYPPDAADRFIFQARLANSEGAALTLAVTPKGKPNALIGVIAIVREEPNALPQIGYWLGKPHWGQGLMTEAVFAAIKAFFALTGYDTLLASTQVANSASRRILEKCGFAFESSGDMPSLPRNGKMEVHRFLLTKERFAQAVETLDEFSLPLPSVLPHRGVSAASRWNRSDPRVGEQELPVVATPVG